VDAVRQLLTAIGRDGYQVKVIDLPQAAMALHARSVILISAHAVAVLNAAELQAAAAHEIGHEYVWTEWSRAHEDGDQERLKTLELVYDAIGAVTLRQMGIDPSRMIGAMEKIARFNRQRFGVATNETHYPTLAERRVFARQIQRWLQDSDMPSPSGRGRH
jgi:membrane-bound ClpP family serine protease